MYAAAYSNLSSQIVEDINELCDGEVPYSCDPDILLVYSHSVKTPRDYNTPTNPVLFRAYKDKKDELHRDTLMVYPNTDVASTAEVLHKVLCDVQEQFPSPSYGLIFSSHGRGWLPVDYSEKIPVNDVWTAPALDGSGRAASHRRVVYPETKWLGIESQTGSGIDIRELAEAIPMKLDFFLVDACLMGCVEFAYELRNTCRNLVVSPTEILSNGFIYSNMAAHLFGSDEPDYKGICADYYNYYMKQSGFYQSATITWVDCTQLDALAEACKDIVAANREGLSKADHDAVQHYFYYYYEDTLPWFFDLRDILEQSGASTEELARLNKALDAAVLYSAATPTFFSLKLERVCGLSMYLPYPASTVLNNYYKSLSWNKATGLIQ